jgi:hypothetical protein
MFHETGNEQEEESITVGHQIEKLCHDKQTTKFRLFTL